MANEHGSCWYCQHEFEQCDVEHEGREHTAGGTYTYTCHDRDCRTVPFLPADLFVCEGCLKLCKERVNKLPKPDYRTAGIKKIDAEFAKRRKRANIPTAKLFNPKTYITKSLAAYYRRFVKGKTDDGVRVEFVLDPAAEVNRKQIASHAVVTFESTTVPLVDNDEPVSSEAAATAA